MRAPVVVSIALAFALAAAQAMADDAAPAAPPRAAKADDAAARPVGIAWFGTWEAGLAEAKRTGRPILLVAAAPQCHGAPGVW